MEGLKHNWLTEDLIDFEFKKYTLLAYLQKVKGRFQAVELYPFLSDLQFHYRNILDIKSGKEVLRSQFPKSLSNVDFKNLKLNYKIMVEDDRVMNELKEIISFAEPNIKYVLEEGKSLHELVEEQLEISPVGVTSLYEKEGYLFINRKTKRDVSIYRYQVSLFENASEKYRGINTTYLGEDFKDFSRTYESIKLNLTKQYLDLPNPATFLVHTDEYYPIQQTILPVAKRILIRNLGMRI